jgi:hypothetical protein
MRVVLLLLVVLSLTACGSWPKNPEEFRKFSSHFSSNVVTVEVERPLSQVAASLHRQADECLAVRIQYEHVHAVFIKTDAGHVTFKPTFTYHGNHAELDVQRKVERTDEIVVGDMPKDGTYELVADATHVSANRTKLVVYRMDGSKADEALSKAVIHWAKGDNLGCPQL